MAAAARRRRAIRRLAHRGRDGALSLDANHETQLTHDDVTSCVHYVHLALTPEQIDRVAAGPVALVVDHPNYTHKAVLGPDTIAELLGDLRED